MDGLDLRHLQCIGKILDGIPGDTTLPRAILALEGAMGCCVLALGAGVSLERARAIHHELTADEETQRLLERSAQGDGDPRQIHGMGAVEDGEPPDTTRPGRRW